MYSFFMFQILHHKMRESRLSRSTSGRQDCTAIQVSLLTRKTEPSRRQSWRAVRSLKRWEAGGRRKLGGDGCVHHLECGGGFSEVY